MIENIRIVKNKKKIRHEKKKSRRGFCQKFLDNKNHILNAKYFEKLKICNDKFEKNVNNEKENVVDRRAKKRHHRRKN